MRRKDIGNRGGNNEMKEAKEEEKEAEKKTRD